jgi:putative transposase
MDENYIHEEQRVHHIFSHLFFCPKRRKKVLVGPVRDRFEQLARQGSRENQWQIVELATQPDHVHLFIQRTPSPLPINIARLITRRCAHELRKQFAHVLTLPSLWTRKTFSRTAGQVSAATIQQDIERQSKQ